MATGWRYVGGKWYYLSEEAATLGIMVKGWQKDPQDSHWYFLDLKDGYMHTGWENYGGKLYYLNPYTPVQTWFLRNSDGRWYWGGSADRPLGAMYENAETPDGYRVGPDGARVN